MLLCFEEFDCETIVTKGHICVKLTYVEENCLDELETAHEETHANFIFHTNDHLQSTLSAITLYMAPANTDIMV